MHVLGLRPNVMGELDDAFLMLEAPAMSRSTAVRELQRSALEDT